jgi:membrane protein DedA with SNARE-associated domain
MRLANFLFWSTLGTAGWSATLAIAGYVLKQQFGEVERVLGPLSSAIIVLIVLGYVWRQLTWHKRHREGADGHKPHRDG